MTVPYTLGFDVTSGNLNTAPGPNSGIQAALYATGTGSIPATPAQRAQYPNALLIGQWPVIATDEAAVVDYFDLENGAIVTNQLPALVGNAVDNFHKSVRIGQRWPAVYCGDNTSPTAVANTLTAAGMGGLGVGLILVNWSMTETQAAAQLSYPASINNPFPVVGVQFSDHGPNGEPYDQDVYANGWLNDRSTVPAPPSPTSGIQANWRWCNKCQSLFFGGNQNKSVCAAGGTHDGTKSYDYSLPWVIAPPITP